MVFFLMAGIILFFFTLFSSMKLVIINSQSITSFVVKFTVVAGKSISHPIPYLSDF